jgi:adenosine deaminase
VGDQSRDLASLPKAHRHLHLEAGMRPSTLASLAAKYGRPVPQVRDYGSFAAFVEMYVAATDVLRERSDWERLADELLADNVAEGAVYVELIFDAINYHSRFATEADCWALVFDVFDEASERHGVSVGWMPGIDRVARDPQSSIELARFAVAHRHRGVVSFGLHNDEVENPPSKYVEPMRIAREGGLQITPHLGELDSGEHVGTALDLFGVTRILHGARSVEVPGLVDRLAAEGVCLDVCPISNVMTGVLGSYAAHPLGALLDAGVRCSVNADDPLLVGSTLLGEYELCRREFGFDDDRMALSRVHQSRLPAHQPSSRSLWPTSTSGSDPVCADRRIPCAPVFGFDFGFSRVPDRRAPALARKRRMPAPRTPRPADRQHRTP